MKALTEIVDRKVDPEKYAKAPAPAPDFGKKKKKKKKKNYEEAMAKKKEKEEADEYDMGTLSLARSVPIGSC